MSTTFMYGKMPVQKQLPKAVCLYTLHVSGVLRIDHFSVSKASQFCIGTELERKRDERHVLSYIYARFAAIFLMGQNRRQLARVPITRPQPWRGQHAGVQAIRTDVSSLELHGLCKSGLSWPPLSGDVMASLALLACPEMQLACSRGCACGLCLILLKIFSHCFLPVARRSLAWNYMAYVHGKHIRAAY
jgi:hypothetical protein